MEYMIVILFGDCVNNTVTVLHFCISTLRDNVARFFCSVQVSFA
jgi:hypothetical protein